jgi:hypothetical protein
MNPTTFLQTADSLTIPAIYGTVIGIGVLGIMCVGLLTAMLLRLKHIDTSLQRLTQPQPQKEIISRAA